MHRGGGWGGPVIRVEGPILPPTPVTRSNNKATGADALVVLVAGGRGGAGGLVRRVGWSGAVGLAAVLGARETLVGSNGPRFEGRVVTK